MRVRTRDFALRSSQDLIHAFSDGKDDDLNGYADDISGWDYRVHLKACALAEDWWSYPTILSKTEL